MSVPTRRGPWWYYSRTEEGKDYGIHCRRPARGLAGAAPGGRARRGGADPARRERAGRGLGLLRRRAAPRSATTTAGWPTRPTAAGTRSTSCSSGPSRPGIAGGLRVGARDRLRPGLVGRRRLRVLRPHGRGPAALPALAPRAGHRPGRRRARLRGGRPALLARDRHHPRHRVGPGRPAQHQHHRVAGHPHRPTRWPSPASSCRAARAWSTPSTTSRPRAAAGWFLVLTNERGTGLPGAGRTRTTPWA